MQTEIAVLGAGLTGLAAADCLINQDKDIIVIEKENEPGGMCRSFKKDGFTFDLGGHRFLSCDQRTTDYVSSLFGNTDELALRERNSQIYLNGRLLIYPPEFMDILKNLGVATCCSGIADSLRCILKCLIKKGPELSLKDWILNRFGPTLYNIYFGPYSRKLWGREAADISSEWAPQRISVPNIAFAMKKMFFRGGKETKTYSRKFLYPEWGIGEIPKRIARRIENHGAKIFTNHKAVKISAVSGGFAITVRAKESQEREILAKKIISTIPLNEFLPALNSTLEEDIFNAAASLQFRSVRFLNLMIDSSQITQNTWLYVPEKDFIFFRIQELSNWHPANCPPGKTALVLEIACDKGDDLWGMEDSSLVEICVRDLIRMGIHIEGKIMGYFCTYSEHAYPVYSLRYKESLRKVYKYIEGSRNLVIAGRQGLFRYFNMDTAIESGFSAAESLYDEARRKEMLNAGAN